MLITILGGSGFVGQSLCRQLLLAGYQVQVITRNAAQQRSLLLHQNLQVSQPHRYDSQGLLPLLKGSQAVINLVGILNEKGRHGHGFELAHVRLVAALLEACRIAGVKRYLHMSALRAGEGSSFYLQSRGQAESLIQRAGQAGEIEATIFQPSVIFGANDRFILRFAEILRYSPVLPLARPQARFQPVWVEDVARALVTTLNHSASIGQNYPLGGPRSYTLSEIVHYTARQLGLRRWIIPLPDFLGRIQAALMDWIPGKPFSSDNFRSLLLDSITPLDGLATLGIRARSMEDIVPLYLNRKHTAQFGRGRQQQRLSQLRQSAGRNRPSIDIHPENHANQGDQ